MALINDQRSASWGFTFANILLIFLLYTRFENTTAFIFVASGILIISYSLKRAISRIIKNVGS